MKARLLDPEVAIDINSLGQFMFETVLDHLDDEDDPDEIVANLKAITEDDYRNKARTWEPDIYEISGEAVYTIDDFVYGDAEKFIRASYEVFCQYINEYADYNGVELD